MTVDYQGTRDVPLGDLTRYPGNARRGDVDQLQQSIRRHGQYRAIVVRDTGGNLVILAGNHTFDALRAEGHKTARCELLTCTDDEARRINLADNRLAELGGYDDDALVELLSYLDDDYEGTGWTADDVDALLNPHVEELPPALNDPDDAPSPPGNRYPSLAMSGCSARTACCAATPPTSPPWRPCSTATAATSCGPTRPTASTTLARPSRH